MCFCVETFETDTHRSYIYAQVSKAGEKIVEMVGCEGQLGWFYVVVRKVKVREGESCSKCARR